MTAQLLKGREVAERILEGVTRRLAGGAVAPRVAVFHVGDEPAAAQYLRAIRRRAGRVGVDVDARRLPAGTSFAALGDAVGAAAASDGIDGVQILKPVPGGHHVSEVMEHVPATKDVEGVHPENLGLLLLGRPRFVPPTALAVMLLLEHHGIDFSGRKAVVVGRSDTVGKPIAALLVARHATVTTCHSATRDLAAELEGADLVVAAVGRPEVVRGDWIEEGAVVVDLGHHVLPDGRTVGDVHASAVGRAGAITPVPGGAGPITVAVLMSNVSQAARRSA